jgi:hypothetical protein
MRPLPMTHDSTCKNCGHALTGNFCANCGQTSNIHRVTFKHFIHEFFHAFTHTDKGILLLMKELVTRPGYVTREYLDGKRKKYFNPLTFLIILSSLHAYFGKKTGYFAALSRGNRYTGKGAGTFTEAMQFMDNEGKIVSLFLMPVLMSFLSWLFFIRSKNNWAENLVLNSMVLGQVYLAVLLIFIPAFVFLPIPMFIINIVFQLTMLVYMITAYRQFFMNNIFLTILKTIVITFLFIVLFWVCIYSFIIVKHMILD